MKINEGNTDRLIRAILGVVLLALAFTSLTGAWVYVAGVVGAVLLLTGAVGFCPLYTLLGINTCPVEQRRS